MLEIVRIDEASATMRRHWRMDSEEQPARRRRRSDQDADRSEPIARLARLFGALVPTARRAALRQRRDHAAGRPVRSAGSGD